MRSAVAISIAVAVCACGASRGGGASNVDAATACTPAKLGLGSATRVTMWKLQCGSVPGGPSTPPLVIRSDDEYAKTFHCGPSGIDFAQNQLVVSARELSPAGAGGDIVDDGNTVTFINIFRAPCPGAPMARPMDYAVAFLLPAGSTRKFADTGCPLDAQC
jgi:hypothetical protein